MLFRVTMETDEVGRDAAECPALPGCATQGNDENEALASIREASVARLGGRPAGKLIGTLRKT